MSNSIKKSEQKLKVSICIPTWNRAEYLPCAIDSLVNQTESSFDIHIFDNASTDNTKEIINSGYREKVFFHEYTYNIGYVGNINRCLDLADRYDWIGILHSDDMHIGESVKTVLRYAKTYLNAGIIFSEYDIVNQQGLVMKKPQSYERIFKAGDQAVMRCQGQIPCSSTFYSSKAILDVGFYSMDFPYSADEEYAARIARKYDIVQTKEILACYRHHGGHTMIKSWAKPDFIKSFEEMRILMNSYLSIRHRKTDKVIRQLVALTLLGQCSGLVAHGELGTAHKFYVNAFKKIPCDFLKPRIFLRFLVHYTPGLGPALCRLLSTNAGYSEKSS